MAMNSSVRRILNSLLLGGKNPVSWEYTVPFLSPWFRIPGTGWNSARLSICLLILWPYPQSHALSNLRSGRNMGKGVYCQLWCSRKSPTTIEIGKMLRVSPRSDMASSKLPPGSDITFFTRLLKFCQSLSASAIEIRGFPRPWPESATFPRYYPSKCLGICWCKAGNPKWCPSRIWVRTHLLSEAEIFQKWNHILLF